MVLPYNFGGTADEMVGYSYGAFVLRTGSGDPGTNGSDTNDPDPTEDALAALREVLPPLRFSGWVAPSMDGMIVVVGNPGGGVTAGGRRGIVEVAGAVAERSGTPVIAIRVKADAQLGLVAWENGEEVARYCSDPSREPTADEEVLDSPIGAEDAPMLARLCGLGEATGEELEKLLDEGLDPEATSESERLRDVLRLLQLPSWIVATGSLPKRLSVGPLLSSMTRLRVGQVGATGMLWNVAVRRMRERWEPPPIITDPPSMEMPDFDPFLM